MVEKTDIICNALERLFSSEGECCGSNLSPIKVVAPNMWHASHISKDNAPGLFITFEGGDGSGKSTHVDFLSALLSDIGFDVVSVREPGATSIGEKLRDVVLDSKYAAMSPRCELLIYEAARAQLVDEVISPALTDGKVVLCDRFFDSSVAYQGYGRGLPLDFINSANDFASHGIRPDVTIVFSCSDRAEKQDRVDRRDASKDRLELAGSNFHTRVAHAFDDLAALEPKRVKVVDTTGTHSKTARFVFAALSEVLPALCDGTLNLECALDAFDCCHKSSKTLRGLNG